MPESIATSQPEDAGQAVALYDFLYRDVNRIASYYAQLFKGKLSGIEQTDQTKEAKDTAVRAGVPAVAGGDFKMASENLRSHKESIDPHDLVTTDVLAYFAQQDWLDSDVERAPHGALVKIKGTLIFVDRVLLDVAIEAFKLLLADAKKKAKTHEDREAIRVQEFGAKAMEKVSIPGAFLLNTSEGVSVVGIVKESGMEEPIVSYYFRHGTAGLSDVHLIGIKETPSHAFTLSNTQLFGAAQELVKALSEFLFSSESVRVTPIAMFREL